MKKVLAGLDLGGTNIKWVLFHPGDERPLRSGQVNTKLGHGPGAIADQLSSLARQAALLAQRDGLRVTALGIGAPGLVNDGVVRNSPNLPGWHRGVSLLKMVQKRLAGLEIPVTVENDVNCMLTAECIIGARRGYSQVVGLAIGTGVGGGLWIDGKLVKGANGGAGELGHMTVALDGPRCKCGNHGCLEALIGSEAIVSRYLGYRKEARKRRLSVAIIAGLARHGDQAAIRTLAETGRILGAALAGLANIINPQLFVIGGGISQSGRLMMVPAAREMRSRAMPYNLKGLKIKTAKLGPLSGAVGAAIMAGLRHKN